MLRREPSPLIPAQQIDNPRTLAVMGCQTTTHPKVCERSKNRKTEKPVDHDVECISGYKPREEIKTPRLGNSDDPCLRVRSGLRNEKFFARNSA